MKINSQVMVMREAITRLVPMLSAKKVQVTLRGMRAFVTFDPVTHEPIRVNLPYLPDDASDELIAAVHGFLDHEVGHILFTNPAEIGRGVALGKTVKFLHNALEDPAVAEGKMKTHFRGSAYNLANVSNFFLQRMVQPRLSEHLLNGDADRVTAQLMVPAIRAWAGQQEFVDFMEGKWHHIKAWTKSVGQDLIDEVKLCDNSTDTLELAIKMFARLGEVAPPPPPPNEPGEGDAGQEGESSEGEPGEDEAADQGEGSSGSGDDPGESQGEDEAEGSGGSSSGEPGEDEAEGAAAGSPTDDEGKGAGKEEKTPEEQPRGALRGQMDPELRKNLIAAINDQPDFDSSLAEILTDLAEDSSANSDYLVFTRDDDLIEPLPTTPAAVSGVAAMQQEVDDMLGPLANDIARMIEARSAAVFTGGHKSGRLHGASLTRLKFGRVDVFRRKQENKTKFVAVSIVADISGSMTSNGKLKTAMYTCYALSSILDRLGIANEVIGYTTKNHSREVFDDLQRDPLRKSYARYEALYMPIFKGFDERMDTTVRARFVHATNSRSLCSCNVDGESLLIAHRRLSARREARKIMLSLSDGSPAVSGNGNLDLHLKAVVKSIEASGTDVVGLGICDANVKRFYKNHIVMRSVADLPGVVGGELKRLLLK